MLQHDVILTILTLYDTQHAIKTNVTTAQVKVEPLKLRNCTFATFGTFFQFTTCSLVKSVKMTTCSIVKEVKRLNRSNMLFLRKVIVTNRVG